MTPFFSVVVALYNIERCFKSGLECLTRQSFRDFEIILVDDGSKDQTPELCDRAAEPNSNVKVIHQQNKGLGAARNTGIKHANGKYLCFFDLDDLVGEDWLTDIYNEVKDVEPDLLVYGYKEFDDKFKSENIFRFERAFWSERSQLVKGFTKFLSGMQFNNGFAWNKVYKKEFIDAYKLRFPDDTIQQDEIFNHKVYQYFPKILISDKILYNYYVYSSGINRKRYIPHRIECFENVKNSFLAIKNKFEIMDNRLDYYIHRRFLINVLYNRNPLYTLKERRDFFSTIINNSQVIDSAECLKKHSHNIRVIHDFLFSVYCLGIRKKSIASLLIVDYLNVGISFLSGLFHK